MDRALPFIVIASANAQGVMDISPKGDPPGFVRVLDTRTIAVPDRLGNRRIDTFLNVLENPKGCDHLHRAATGRDPARERRGAQRSGVQKKVPALALLIHVKEGLFHCGKSMIRSRMWQPEGWPSI